MLLYKIIITLEIPIDDEPPVVDEFTHYLRADSAKEALNATEEFLEGTEYKILNMQYSQIYVKDVRKFH